MYVLIGILFIIIGLAMLIKPQFIFKITESWKNYGNDEPSRLYIISTRFGGCFFLIIGIASIIVFFVN